MNTLPLRPWWPATPHAAAALAISLRAREATAQLFEFCALAAAAQHWDIFTSAMAALCDVGVRAVRNMVETAKFDSSWSILYGQTTMPPDLFPLFIEILKVARTFQPVEGEPANRTQRLTVLQQAMTNPDLRGLKLPAELKAALLA